LVFFRFKKGNAGKKKQLCTAIFELEQHPTEHFFAESPQIRLKMIFQVIQIFI
jgi:hypothetical protein